VARKIGNSMPEVARRIIARTADQFPITLVGLGLITTILWVGAVSVFAFGRVWSVLEITIVAMFG
jgi:hypothetical protein